MTRTIKKGSKVFIEQFIRHECQVLRNRWCPAADKKCLIKKLKCQEKKGLPEGGRETKGKSELTELPGVGSE